MRKHEKERMKRIRLNQNLAKAKKRVWGAYIAKAGNRHELMPEHVNDPAFVHSIVASLSVKTLRLIANHPDRFTFPRNEELHRLAVDIVAEKTMKLEKE